MGFLKIVPDEIGKDELIEHRFRAWLTSDENHQILLGDFTQGVASMVFYLERNGWDQESALIATSHAINGVFQAVMQGSFEADDTYD